MSGKGEAASRRPSVDGNADIFARQQQRGELAWRPVLMKAPESRMKALCIAFAVSLVGVSSSRAQPSSLLVTLLSLSSVDMRVPRLQKR